jgi:hypothetical protein
MSSNRVKSSDNVLLGKDINPKLISCSESPKRLDSGAKFIYVSYNGKPLVIQTPEMSIPFDKKEIKDEVDESKILSVKIDLSFKGKDDKKSLAKFYNVIEGIDEEVINNAIKNSMAWFKKPHPSTDDKNYDREMSVVRATIEDKYNRVLRHSKDKDTNKPNFKYPSTMQVKVPIKNNMMDVESYDANENEIDINTTSLKGANASCIISLSGLWMGGGNFGLTWKLVQIRVSLKSVIQGYSFIKDNSDDELSDTEEDNKKKKITAATVSSDEDKDDSEKNDDSDDELEIKKISISDDEPEPEPEPVAKKVVRKKK